MEGGFVDFTGEDVGLLEGGVVGKGVVGRTGGIVGCLEGDAVGYGNRREG